MKSPLTRLSNLFDETRGLAGWEAVIWLLIAACAFALIATLVYSSGRLIGADGSPEAQTSAHSRSN
jgi:hypothetical protein